MTIEKVTQIFREVMYIDENEHLDTDKSLFLDYDMTSIDFIDFSFEVKKAFSLSAEPDDIWPVNKMATMPELYSAEKKHWTEKGLIRLNVMLACSGQPAIVDPAIELRSLYTFFTLQYVSEKVRELQ